MGIAIQPFEPYSRRLDHLMLQSMTLFLPQLSLPGNLFLRQNRIRELLERAGDVSHFLDDPPDDGLVDDALQMVDGAGHGLSGSWIL